ncbi:MAG: cysteine synthase A [Gemmatimonadetes bacterium]|jgi:cysteine synthase A|nr:cysteine synthase A [Gemmatimonadota bacterium]MBT4610141.1 cysteine synthase A [Gemmatimonadota bacterium]MBT5056227.1 cysteine synthase A [Gemmatimonadota bacterium]MBT5146318.1 cysteine synthase A [Gemmatimonadota bacterium]MBT5591241.1 cysteine synthase A [Gemmatimonadota bacterium]
MMASIQEGISQLIGRTPLMRLSALSPTGGATILGKLEYLNPGGSVKDRIALSMIEAAEASGDLHEGVAVVEATSGNTGIGLAMICAQRGYRLILTMPETMSFERRALVTRYGAEVVLTPGDADMAGAVERARQIVEQNPKCIELRQFENPANPEVHRRTTGPEILDATEGNLAAFVAGVGTGGTITGAGEVIKAAHPDVHVVAVEPSASPVLSGGKPGTHAIEGIGAGFVPPILNRDIIDEVITVDDRDAFDMTEALAREESLLVGISSGANVLAARQVAEQLSPEQQVVTILCDTGTRYFSVTEYFQRESGPRPSALL